MSIEDEVRPVESEMLQMSQCQPKHTGIKHAYLIVASALLSAWHEVHSRIGRLDAAPMDV